MKKEKKFLKDFENFCLKNELFPESLLLGLSGGADSVCLFHCYNFFKEKYKIKIFASHINYGIRENDADEDQKFSMELCEKHKIKIFTQKFQNLKTKDENSLRKLRMLFFIETAKKENIKQIALAHNEDDNAETILLNMIRGCGLKGICGIKIKQNSFIHPLLWASKSRIKEFLREQNFTWKEDYTNFESKYSRNKIRNIAIPWINKKFSVNFTKKINLLANNLNQIHAMMNKYFLSSIGNFILKEEKEKIILNLKELKKANSYEKFNLFLFIQNKLNNKENDFYYENYKQINNLISSKGNKFHKIKADLWVYKNYEELIFSNKEIINKKNEQILLITQIKNQNISFENYIFKFEIIAEIKEKKTNTAYFDISKLSLPLYLRHIKEKDFFYPLNFSGSKKIKKFFIDEKINLSERNKIVLLADKEKILWICGMRQDKRAYPQSDCQKILKISMKKL